MGTCCAVSQNGNSQPNMAEYQPQPQFFDIGYQSTLQYIKGALIHTHNQEQQNQIQQQPQQKNDNGPNISLNAGDQQNLYPQQNQYANLELPPRNINNQQSNVNGTQSSSNNYSRQLESLINYAVGNVVQQIPEEHQEQQISQFLLKQNDQVSSEVKSFGTPNQRNLNGATLSHYSV